MDSAGNGKLNLNTLHESKLAVARQFADLCTTLEMPDATSPWNYVAQEVTVGDSLDVSIRRTWHLDSEVLLSIYKDLDDQALIPLTPLDSSSPSANRVTIAALPTVRTTTPIPARTLASLLASTSMDEPAWRRWLAVPMTASEFTSSPVVNVQAVSEYGSPSADAFNLRQLWPVGNVEIIFNGVTPFTALTAKFPAYASVDVVGIRCTIQWSHYANTIRELLASDRIKQAPDGAKGVWQALYTAIDESCFFDVSPMLKEITAAVEKAALSALGDKLQRKTADIWSGGLAQATKAFDAWTEAFNGGEPRSDEVQRAAEGLITTLDGGTTFVLPGRLSREGNIEQAALVAQLRGAVDRLVRVDSVVAPFTSEREPSTQGKRSSLILALLGLVLLGTAAVDLSWLPDWRFFNWLPNTTALDEAARETKANSLREAMVALLVIFPAALYGQFFQLRPSSLVGHRAQSGTFAALSILFALPILPAAVMAVTDMLPLTSAMSSVIGIAAIAIAVVVWILFSDTALRRVRTRALIRELKVGPASSASRNRVEGA
jgi:hypothetical protein